MLSPMQLLTIAEALTDIYDEPTGEMGEQLEKALTAREWGRLGGMAGRGACKAHPVLGERNGAAKLTERRVRQIRRLAASGWRASEIAKEIGVNAYTITDVLKGVTWRHVE